MNVWWNIFFQECSSMQTKMNFLLGTKPALSYSISFKKYNEQESSIYSLKHPLYFFFAPNIFCSGLGKSIRLKLCAWNLLKWKTLWVSLYRRWNISSGLLMEYFYPKTPPTLRPFNNESTAAREMEPKQMEYSSIFLLIRIFDEPSIILDIP